MFSTMVCFEFFSSHSYRISKLKFRSTQSSATSSHTCPLCREDINSDSGFLLAETPKYDNVKKTLTESILSLPVDYKTRFRNHDK